MYGISSLDKNVSFLVYALIAVKVKYNNIWLRKHIKPEQSLENFNYCAHLVQGYRVTRVYTVSGQVYGELCTHGSF